MNLQELLITLRAEETPKAAAMRLDISERYYRYLEAGWDSQRNRPVNPSPAILKKVATGFKVDYNLLARAAGLPLEEEQPVPFQHNANLNSWYNSLPTQDEKLVMQLYEIWNIIKDG